MSIADARVNRARAVRIEDELRQRGIHLRRSGHYMSGPCPRCGGDDRFNVNVHQQLWLCRGCTPPQKGKPPSDVIALVMHLDGCTFADAVATLVGEDRPPTARHASQDTKRNEKRERSDKAE
jgi:hypothetical protein